MARGKTNRGILIWRQHQEAVDFYNTFAERERAMTKPETNRALGHIDTLTDIVQELMDRLYDISKVATFQEEVTS